MGDWGVSSNGRGPTSAPDPKRRRFETPPRRAPSRPPPTAVRFTGVPSEYTHETLEELHDAFGVAPEALKSSEFLFGSASDSGEQLAACDVVVQYADASSAKKAAEAFNDQPVESFEGKVFNMNTQLVHKEQRESSRAGIAQVRPQVQDARRTIPKDGPERIYPSVYLADVPVEYTEEMVKELHTNFGLDAGHIMSVKMLPSQGISVETTACIVRYWNQQSAESAVQALRSQSVELPSGEIKRLGARMAKPARWMVEKGFAGGEQEESLGEAQGNRDSVEDCGEGMYCAGKAGMLIFEDTVSGRAFCEACWDSWEARTGQVTA